MSVLNDMLRNLESRGAAADVPALAAAARPAAPAFSLRPVRGRSGRVWVWSSTAFVVAGVIAGLMWQEHQTRAGQERRKPLGWSTYGAAIAQTADTTFVAPLTTVAMADPRPDARSVAPVAAAAAGSAAPAAMAAAADATASAAVSASVSAPVSGSASAPITRQDVSTASPRATRRPTRDATGASPTAGGAADDRNAAPADAGASISISASASKDRNTIADITRAGELIARGRNSEAVPLLAQVLVREPAHAQARAALVALFAENGQRERALVLLLDGAQIDPARFAASAAQLQAELGDAAGALVTLERMPAARRTPAHYALVGGLAHRNKQPDVAVDAYARAVASADAQGVWWVGLALAHEALGQNAQARAAFVRATSHANLPADVRSFVTTRLQAVVGDTRRDSATVAASAP